MELITVRNVSKQFRSQQRVVPALHDITLQIRQGEFFVIVGPSGSGKSTLLRLMAGFDQNYSGTIEHTETIKRSEMSFVFQHFALLPWLTIFENVEIGILAHQLAASERKNAVNAELKRFGLSAFADTCPKDLSGGMQQRVGLARALVNRPKIMFMDEPFSELDTFTASELRRELLDIWQQHHLTVVMVTHIVQEAVELADRVAVFTARPGKLEQIVSNKLPRPRNLRSADAFQLEDRLTKLVRP